MVVLCLLRMIASPCRGAAEDTRAALERPEHDLQRVVDRAEFGLRKRADAPAEPGSIESADLLREDSRSPAGDLDLWAEDGRERARRGRRNDDSRQPAQQICLHYDRVPPASLLAACRASRRSERVDVTSPHSMLPSALGLPRPLGGRPRRHRLGQRRRQRSRTDAGARCRQPPLESPRTGSCRRA
jgi:hypothetical protein